MKACLYGNWDQFCYLQAMVMNNILSRVHIAGIDALINVFLLCHKRPGTKNTLWRPLSPYSSVNLFQISFIEIAAVTVQINSFHRVFILKNNKCLQEILNINQKPAIVSLIVSIKAQMYPHEKDLDRGSTVIPMNAHKRTVAWKRAQKAFQSNSLLYENMEIVVKSTIPINCLNFCKSLKLQ